MVSAIEYEARAEYWARGADFWRSALNVEPRTRKNVIRRCQDICAMYAAKAEQAIMQEAR